MRTYLRFCFRGYFRGPLFVGGELQCDAFAGYGGLFDPEGSWHMTHIGCWSHARRKFHDARYTIRV
ncbi:MAG: IS66 family transposase [Phycisphaerales bacterium]